MFTNPDKYYEREIVHLTQTLQYNPLGDGNVIKEEVARFEEEVRNRDVLVLTLYGETFSEMRKFVKYIRNINPNIIRGIANALKLSPAYLLYLADVINKDEWREIDRPGAGMRSAGIGQTFHHKTPRPADGHWPYGLYSLEWDIVSSLRQQPRKLVANFLLILKRLSSLEETCS